MKTNEWAGVGNHYEAKYWEYDSRTARRYNLDPQSEANISDYATFGGNPIFNKDYLGNVIAPWWLKSVTGYILPSYTGGGVRSDYKSFRNEQHLNEFNQSVAQLYRSNNIFRNCVSRLISSKITYQVQQGYFTSMFSSARYDPTNKTVFINWEGIDNAALFEETFHAAQDDYYGENGINKSSLSLEIEAKVANLLSGYKDITVTGEYPAIREYINTGVETPGYHSEFNSLTNSVYSAYASRLGAEWAAKNPPSSVNQHSALDFLRHSNKSGSGSKKKEKVDKDQHHEKEARKAWKKAGKG